jgi:hypothetical protein
MSVSSESSPGATAIRPFTIPRVRSLASPFSHLVVVSGQQLVDRCRTRLHLLG